MRKIISISDAKKIKPDAAFIGSSKECWDFAINNGWEGTIPLESLSGSEFIADDNPRWTKVNVEYVNEKDEMLFYLFKEKPEYEIISISWCDKTYKVERFQIADKEHKYLNSFREPDKKTWDGLSEDDRVRLLTSYFSTTREEKLKVTL